jgi:uncharacterized protein
MKTRDFVVLAYGAFGGEISGKTNLQKKVYFLGVGLGRESDLGYRPHYYGPYSAEVAEANSELRSMGYLSERSTNWGSDNRGFEIARYDCALTEDGIRLFEKKKQEYPELWERLAGFAEVMKAAGELNYWELSIAAKAYFILKSAGAQTGPEEIQKAALKLGWEVRKEEIRKACEFLEIVGLVQRPAA